MQVFVFNSSVFVLVANNSIIKQYINITILFFSTSGDQFSVFIDFLCTFTYIAIKTWSKHTKLTILYPITLLIPSHTTIICILAAFSCNRT